MRIKAFFNKITNNTLPAGVWGDNFDNHCKQHPEEFDIIYDEVDDPTDEKPEVYTESQLKTYSMADLRAVYEAKCEGVSEPPPPTNSKDGIIKAILELQRS